MLPDVVVIFTSISAFLLLFLMLSSPDTVSVSTYISFLLFICTFPDLVVIEEFSDIFNESISMLPDLAINLQ